MRTKHVLMAMALPALFAACTSDEFVEQPAQGNLDGRAVLGNLKVNVAEDAATRFAWEDLKWSFEEGDQFGAAVTDPKTLWTVESDVLLGNYIFSNESGSWNTTSQMVEGTYLFYSYNQPESFVTKNDRKPIHFDLTTQKADLNDPEKVISENQLFISPLYKIAKENTTEENTIELPLRFIPYYSTAAFYIKNSTGKEFSISQIVLEGNFIAKGDIDPTKINTAKLVYSVPEGGSAYELEALKKDNANVDKAYDDAYKANNFAANTENSTSLVLDCGDYVLANGKDVVAYMQVPVGTQTDMKVSIIVKVGGESKEIRVEKAEDGNKDNGFVMASTGLASVNFDRMNTKAVFGVDNDKMKVLDVKAENLREAGGYYVSTNEELLNVLAVQRGDIKIYNADDVKLDDEIINYINKDYAGQITFANPISIAVKEEKGLTLDSKVVFTAAVTVESGLVSLSGKIVVKDAITVKAGQLTLAGADVEDADITVESGVLNLAAANIKANSIEVTDGTVNVTANQTVGTNGIEALDMEAGVKKTTTLNITGSAVGAVTLDAALDNGLNLKATNVNVNEYATIGTTKGVNLYGKVVNKGTIGTSWSPYVMEDAVVENYGNMVQVVNNGLIKMMDYWDSELSLYSTQGNGLIDNTIGKDLGATGTNTVYSCSTGSISSIPNAHVDVVVLNGTTVADGTEMTPEENQTILLLGNNTFGTIGGKGVKISPATNTTLQIGLAATADQYLTLAQKAADIKFTAQNTPANYSKAMTTTVNAGSIEVGTIKCYGGTNRCAGTIKYTTETEKGDWTLNGNGSVGTGN